MCLLEWFSGKSLGLETNVVACSTLPTLCASKRWVTGRESTVCKINVQYGGNVQRFRPQFTGVPSL